MLKFSRTYGVQRTRGSSEGDSEPGIRHKMRRLCSRAVTGTGLNLEVTLILGQLSAQGAVLSGLADEDCDSGSCWRIAGLRVFSCVPGQVVGLGGGLRFQRFLNQRKLAAKWRQTPLDF